MPQKRQGAFCHAINPELLLRFCQLPKLAPGKSAPAVATALLAAAYFKNLRLLSFVVTLFSPWYFFVLVAKGQAHGLQGLQIIQILLELILGSFIRCISD